MQVAYFLYIYILIYTLLVERAAEASTTSAMILVTQKYALQQAPIPDIYLQQGRGAAAGQQGCHPAFHILQI